MVTTGSKFFYAAATLLITAAVVYGYVTGGGELGPLTVGYKGAVGDHLGYATLLFGATASLFLGFATTAFRDADPEAGSELIGTEVPARLPLPPRSYWPPVTAFGVGLVVVGVVLNNVFFVAGLIALGAVAVEWTMQAWADRATGDAAVNKELRDRIMLPLEVPIGGALGIVVVVGSFSRVFLTVSKENAVWAALAIAATIFVVGTILGTQQRLRRDLVAGLLLIGALTTIGLGIWGAAEGEREIEPHHAEHEVAEHDENGDGAEHDESGDETEHDEAGEGAAVEESHS